MYLVNVQARYQSAHALRSYKGQAEALHGHSWLVEVGLETDTLGEGGIAFDFVEIDRHLKALVAEVDHKNLNEVPPFDTIEPSAENQARWFHDELRRRLPTGMAEAVAYARVWETAEQWAQYSERSRIDAS